MRHVLDAALQLTPSFEPAYRRSGAGAGMSAEGAIMRRTLATAAVLGAVSIGGGVSSALADAPPGIPGEPNCIGHTHANFAQDWKSFPGEPQGFGRLTRFFGGSPQEGNAEISSECAGG
jgi:hypothetical protein